MLSGEVTERGQDENVNKNNNSINPLEMHKWRDQFGNHRFSEAMSGTTCFHLPHPSLFV